MKTIPWKDYLKAVGMLLGLSLFSVLPIRAETPGAETGTKKNPLKISFRDAPFYVLDPRGLKSGFDPKSKNTHEEIQGSAFRVESLGGSKLYSLSIPDPAPGLFRIVLPIGFTRTDSYQTGKVSVSVGDSGFNRETAVHPAGGERIGYVFTFSYPPREKVPFVVDLDLQETARLSADPGWAMKASASAFRLNSPDPNALFTDSSQRRFGYGESFLTGGLSPLAEIPNAGNVVIWPERMEPRGTPERGVFYYFFQTSKDESYSIDFIGLTPVAPTVSMTVVGWRKGGKLGPSLKWEGDIAVEMERSFALDFSPKDGLVRLTDKGTTPSTRSRAVLQALKERNMKRFGFRLVVQNLVLIGLGFSGGYIFSRRRIGFIGRNPFLTLATLLLVPVLFTAGAIWLGFAGVQPFSDWLPERPPLLIFVVAIFEAPIGIGWFMGATLGVKRQRGDS